MSEWVDVSVSVGPGIVVWPGDPPVANRRAQSIEAGDAANVTALSMGAHTGTHVDAPLHYVDGAAAIDDMDPGATIGPARVVALDSPGPLGATELAGAGVARGERVLLKTRNSARRWFEEPFRDDYVHVAPDGARLLAERGVRAVGVDYLSVGGMGDDGARTHRILLEAGVWIVEGLWLGDVEPGRYELVCLPVKLAGADGAPARALLRPV